MKQFKRRQELAQRLAEAISEIERLRNENRELTRKLYDDELTHLANRRFFEEKFPSLVEVASANGEPLALLIADVNGLKRTNDTLGHKTGDELLVTVARALVHAARETDIAGRLGGDEYYVILPGFTPLYGQSESGLMDEATARFKKQIDEKVSELGLPESLAVDVSFGIAGLAPGESSYELYHKADEICQRNKRAFYEKLKKKGKSFEDERTLS